MTSAPNTKPPTAPFDGLLRADRRRQRPAAERAAGVVLRRVADDHGEHQQEQRRAARAARGWRSSRRSAARDRATETAPPTPTRARRARRATRPEPRAPMRDERRHQHDVERQPRSAGATTGERQQRQASPPAPTAQRGTRAPLARASAGVARARQHAAALRRPHEEQRGGANQTTPTATAMRTAPLRTRRHLTPSATERGDGLMPP